VFYRPGLVTGDSQSGKSASRDFLSLFIRGIVRLGCLPPLDARELFVDITPIDYAASALIHLARLAGHHNGDTFHLAGAGRASLQGLLDVLTQRGIHLETVSVPRWHDRLTALHRVSPEAAAACLALCRGLPDGTGFASYRTMDLFQATGVVFDMTLTQAGLAGSGIVCPLPTPELLGRYIDHILPLATES
jgi:hypothetical protein